MAGDGTKVGSAYVEVTPKAAGNFKSAIESQMPKGDASGGKFGSSFSEGMTKAVGAGSVMLGNILSDVVQSAASAVGEQLSRTFWNYADYEQLVGGVDTLFKDASSTVQENAKKAFSTAGLSANEYMENVTSFSASLISSLDGDTARAAEVADKAMVDMSDNANKMGTDMEAITNAYQGFAKGNYTMLDNLKLGYGGTKTEMERLLKDASEIAGVEFSIDSYADVIEAIHVMQESMDISGYSVDDLKQKLSDMSLSGEEVQKVADDLGISYDEAMQRMLDGTLSVTDAQVLLGTTAKEGSTTISGSLGQLGAAWDNFLTALGDGGETMDLSEVTSNLIESLGAVGRNVLPAIARIGKSIALELPGIMAEALAEVPAMVQEMVADAFGEDAGAMVSGLFAGFDEAAPLVESALASVTGIVSQVLPVIQGIVLPVASETASAVGSAVATVSSAVTDLLAFVDANVMPTVAAVADQVMPAVQEVAGFVSEVLGDVSSFVGETFGDVLALADEVWPDVSSTVQAAMDIVKQVVPPVWNAIKAIVTTVMNAVRSVVQTVWPIVSGIVTNAATNIKNAISGISSIVGTVQNIFNRVKSAITDPINTAKSLISTAINNIKSLFSGLNIEIPKPRIPKVTVDGGEAPWGIGGKGRLPSFDVQWAAMGGIVDGATLIGAGERGAEFIWPSYDPYMSRYAEAIADAMPAGGGVTVNLYYTNDADAAAMARDVAWEIRRYELAGAF